MLGFGKKTTILKKVFLLNLIFTGCSPTWMCQALPSLGCSQVSILCKLLLLCILDYWHFQYLSCKYFRLPQMLECCPNPEPMMDHIHQLTDILFQDKCTTAGQFFILSSIFHFIQRCFTIVFTILTCLFTFNQLLLPRRLRTPKHSAVVSLEYYS